MTQGVALDEELGIKLVLEVAELLPFGASDDAIAELPDESGMPLLVGYDLRAAGEDVMISFLPAGV